MASQTHASALTIEEKDAFDNQNGATVVQALRTEPGVIVDVVSDSSCFTENLNFLFLFLF